MYTSKNLSAKSLEAKVDLQERRKLQEIARGFRHSQILLTCVELGVFDLLAQRDATAHEISELSGTDPRGMELLLNAAVALGLLAKNDSLFSNTPLAAAYLVKDSEGNIAHSLKLESAFYRRWGFLADAVRTGKRPVENRQDEQPEDWVRNFIYALYNQSRQVAPVVAEALALPVDQSIRVIDVGGGHGGYSLALAKRYPLLTAVVYELPRVVPVAREIIEQAGLSDRVSVQQGDFQRENLGYGYDVVLIFGVLNGESPDGRFELIKKAYEVLKPGGLVVLRDYVLDEDRAGPLEASVFALQMLLATNSGGLDTRDEWERWLLMAGFSPPQTIPLPPWAGSSLVVAKKS